MALKPLSTALRRLSGKKVERDHLRAVLASALRFSDLAMGPIRREIRRPAEEVALSLSASLASMTSHRNLLAGENRRQKDNIKKLRASLKGERELSGRRQELLDRSNLEARGPGQGCKGAKGRAIVTRADQALARKLEEELFETSALAQSLASAPGAQKQGLGRAKGQASGTAPPLPPLPVRGGLAGLLARPGL